MTTATSNRKLDWQAELRWEKRFYTTVEEVPQAETVETPEGEVAAAHEATTVEFPHQARVCFVDLFRSGHDAITFRVNYRKGRPFTISDPRELTAGTAGVTGIWGTLPAPPVYKPRPLSLAAFRAELTRLVGPERAEEVIQVFRSGFFRPFSDKCQTLRRQSKRPPHPALGRPLPAGAR